MAAIMVASSYCYCHTSDLVNQQRGHDSFSFSPSIFIPLANVNRRRFDRNPRSKSLFIVEVRQTDSQVSRYNERAVKMVPASKAVKKASPNGKTVDFVNGKKQAINGSSIARRDPGPAPMKTPSYRKMDKLPPVEGLKVLPSDETFSWANENYNNWQRTADVWSFILSLRVRVMFDNAKWAYFCSFSEEKQKI